MTARGCPRGPADISRTEFVKLDESSRSLALIFHRAREVCHAPGLMEGSITRKDLFMAAPRKYLDELRERATRMAVDARKDPEVRVGAMRRIADQLGIHRRGATDVGDQSRDRRRVAPRGQSQTMRCASRNWRRRTGNSSEPTAVLKAASAFFAAEQMRPSR